MPCDRIGPKQRGSYRIDISQEGTVGRKIIEQAGPAQCADQPGKAPIIPMKSLLEDENAIRKKGYHQQREWYSPLRKPFFHLQNPQMIQNSKSRIASITRSWSELLSPLWNGRRTSRSLISSVTGQSPGCPPNFFPMSERCNGK